MRMSKPESVKKNLRAGLVSRLRTLTGQGGIPRLKPTKRDRPWPGAWAKRLAFLGLMLIPVLPSIAADYRDYPDDVRLLLEEYAGASDQGGSLIPSVYAFRSSQTERVLIDFDRGLIVVSAPSISLLLKDIQDVLLTQIDPGVIDAGTANDLGLQGKSGKPFLYGQVHDHKGQSIDTQEKAEAFAFHLFDTALSQRGDFTVRIPMIRQHKSVAGNKYEQWVRAASSKHRIRSSLIVRVISIVGGNVGQYWNEHQAEECESPCPCPRPGSISFTWLQPRYSVSACQRSSPADGSIAQVSLD